MAEGEEERGGGVCNLICQGHTLEKEEEQVGGLEVRAGDTKKEQRMERRRRKRRRRLWLMQLVPFQSQRRRNSIKEEGAGSSSTFPKPGREWRVLVFVCSFYTESASTMNGRFPFPVQHMGIEKTGKEKALIEVFSWFPLFWGRPTARKEVGLFTGFPK